MINSRVTTVGTNQLSLSVDTLIGKCFSLAMLHQVVNRHDEV